MGVRGLFTLLVLLLLLAALVYLPMKAGYAELPRNWAPEEVGAFIGGVVKYWEDVARAALRALGS